jgi:hypothetical protein
MGFKSTSVGRLLVVWTAYLTECCQRDSADAKRGFRAIVHAIGSFILVQGNVIEACLTCCTVVVSQDSV